MECGLANTPSRRLVQGTRVWNPDGARLRTQELHMSAMKSPNTEGISVDSSVIAQVLGRAHRTAEAQHDTSGARAILAVAHSFADELASTDPLLDRVAFIQAATEHPS